MSDSRAGDLRDRLRRGGQFLKARFDGLARLADPLSHLIVGLPKMRKHVVTRVEQHLQTGSLVHLHRNCRRWPLSNASSWQPTGAQTGAQKRQSSMVDTSTPRLQNRGLQVRVLPPLFAVKVRALRGHDYFQRLQRLAHRGLSRARHVGRGGTRFWLGGESGERSNPCGRFGPDQRALTPVESDETERPGTLRMVLL
jgi:hypothetical protein